MSSLEVYFKTDCGADAVCGATLVGLVVSVGTGLFLTLFLEGAILLCFDGYTGRNGIASICKVI